MKKSAEPIRILFVCTGNICRSPTAEAVFRDQVTKAGLDANFLIDSAGTHGYHIGDPPDPRAVATAMSHGVDMREIRARKVEIQDYSLFNYIVAIDAGHLQILERQAPKGGDAEISLFLDNANVPDPYYGKLQEFQDVYSLIEKGCIRLLEKIVKASRFTG